MGAGAVRPPLGARLDGAGGATFGVYSSVAQGVEVCLLAPDGTETRHALTRGEGDVWTGRVDGVRAGQAYGYRVHGPWDPAAGLWCNPAKLLLDPYAECITGTVTWDPAVYGYVPGTLKSGQPVRSDADSAPYVPHSLVVDHDTFDWAGDAPLRKPLTESMVYEGHVKGLTHLLADVPEAVRGTYAGLAHPAAIERITRLGVTAVELLPVHTFVPERFLVEAGLTNYWGYQSIGFFAPHEAWASACGLAVVDEVKQLVRALHTAGLEVILDVVFNHTGEGGAGGPTLAFRGLDNRAYYRLAGSPEVFVDDTGTGNTIDAHGDPGLSLILDSLRHWVRHYHVDGFRFDLAAVLGLGDGPTASFEACGAFLSAVAEDEVLRHVKLIAEPWDAVSDYEEGQFPRGWSEWNDHFRNTVRDFWRGVPGCVPDLATRIAGSSDLFAINGRRPVASVNLVTCHDGFTLTDLVSYNVKHNEANPDQGGTDDNRSWNCGVEGPTDDSGILALRERQRRNFLATLLLSAGVPMILAGDEIGRTQRGNNNAYCQDNAMSWLDWDAAASGGTDDSELVAFLTDLRCQHTAFRSPTYAAERVTWYRPDGRVMELADWQAGWARSLCAHLCEPSAGDGNPDVAEFFVVLNAWDGELVVTPPELVDNRPWRCILDTTTGQFGAGTPVGPTLDVGPRSLVLLQR